MTTPLSSFHGRLAGCITAATMSAMFLLSGCGPTKVVVQRDTTTIVRTEIQEVLRDTTIYVTLPSESATNTTRDTTSHLEIGPAISDATVSGGVLTHTLLSNPEYSAPADIQCKDRIFYRDSVVFVSKEVPVPVEKPLSLADKLLRIFGFCFIGTIIAGVVFIFLKK